MMVGSAMGNLASAVAIRNEDAALVAALKDGSEEAFALLITQYSQPVFSLLTRSLHDRSDAADMTQEVFIKVFRGIRSFHEDSSLRTWIYRIALREASNQRRWWSRHKSQEITIDTPVGAAESDDGGSLQGLSATLADLTGSPLDLARQAEIKAWVEAALERLPEPFRVAVVLRELEGFSYDEIAEVLGVPAGTVKSRCARGRIGLKEIFVSEGMASLLAPSPHGTGRGRAAYGDAQLQSERGAR